MYFRFIVFTLLAACTLGACTAETVETVNEQGQRVRFERRKKDGARQGRYQRFHPNGAVLEIAFYFNDSLHGERKFYYPNGVVESTENYHKGRLQGKYRKFRENGTLYIEQNFENGAMEGLSLRYYPNGVLEEKVTILHSEENGPFREFYENGNLKAEGTYAPDSSGESLEQGELREYDDHGQLIRIADCVRGVCRTRWKRN